MKLVKGNLLEVSAPAFLVQQCNCNTVKSKGLAAAIERRFPYCNVYQRRQPRIPGTYQLFSAVDQPTIVCLMAQWAPGIPGSYDRFYPDPPEGQKDTAEQRREWFGDALTAFLTEVDRGGQPVCLPYQIGCGLAGGDWAEYQKILERLEKKFDLEFIVYQLE